VQHFQFSVFRFFFFFSKRLTTDSVADDASNNARNFVCVWFHDQQSANDSRMLSIAFAITSSSVVAVLKSLSSRRRALNDNDPQYYYRPDKCESHRSWQYHRGKRMQMCAVYVFDGTNSAPTLHDRARQQTSFVVDWRRHFKQKTSEIVILRTFPRRASRAD
jgi:hypothetical protein